MFITFFTDSAKGNKLRKTGIPIPADKKGNLFIEDADAKNFLRAQLQNADFFLLDNLAYVRY
jgi:hypothetical protein